MPTSMIRMENGLRRNVLIKNVLIVRIGQIAIRCTFGFL